MTTNPVLTESFGNFVTLMHLHRVDQLGQLRAAALFFLIFFLRVINTLREVNGTMNTVNGLHEGCHLMETFGL